MLGDITSASLLVLAVMLAVASVSAAITGVAGVLDRRKTYGLLRLAGTPLSVLDGARLREALAPLVLLGGGAVATGALCALPLMASADWDSVRPAGPDKARRPRAVRRPRRGSRGVRRCPQPPTRHAPGNGARRMNRRGPAPARSRTPAPGRIGMRPTATTGVGRGHRPRDPEDYEGYEVHDPLGQRVGRAEKLFTNGDGDPKHVRVRLGLFGKSVLIPVWGITVDHEQRTIVLGSSASGGSC